MEEGFSAGNTRGLIEATKFDNTPSMSKPSFPRGIPAASLKPAGV